MQRHLTLWEYLCFDQFRSITNPCAKSSSYDKNDIWNSWKNIRRQIDKVSNYVTHKCREECRILDNKSVVKLKFLLVKDSQVRFSSNSAACPWLRLSLSLSHSQGPVVELNFKGVLSWSHSLGREHSNGDRMHTFTLGLANRRRGLKKMLWMLQ